MSVHIYRKSKHQSIEIAMSIKLYTYIGTGGYLVDTNMLNKRTEKNCWLQRTVKRAHVLLYVKYCMYRWKVCGRTNNSLAYAKRNKAATPNMKTKLTSSKSFTLNRLTKQKETELSTCTLHIPKTLCQRTVVDWVARVQAICQNIKYHCTYAPIGEQCTELEWMCSANCCRPQQRTTNRSQISTSRIIQH